METNFTHFPFIPNDIIANSFIQNITEEKDLVAFAQTNKNHWNIIHTNYPTLLLQYQCKMRKLRILNTLKANAKNFSECPDEFFDYYINTITHNQDTNEYIRHNTQKIFPISFNRYGNHCTLLLPILCDACSTSFKCKDTLFALLDASITPANIIIYGIRKIYENIITTRYCKIDGNSLFPPLQLKLLYKYPLLIKKILSTESKQSAYGCIYQLSDIRSNKKPLHDAEKKFITNIVTDNKDDAYITENSIVQWALFCYKYGNIDEMVTAFSAFYNYNHKSINTPDLVEITYDKQLKTVYKQCSFDNIEPLKQYMDVAYTKITAELACEKS
jgi:hypothetical protein